ncbi:mitochondrial protein [Coprinopsis sp. MPI-PUGE-AT-0042]|nr:mitochondrial protein [Coprinopsis sp. MPI-PUGE-AT-0042]
MASSFSRRLSQASHFKRLQNGAGGRQFFSTTPPPLPKPPGRSWGSLKLVSGAVVLSTVAATLGAIYPPPPISILFPRAAPGPPSDPLSPDSITYTEGLERKLQELPYLKKLRNAPDAKEWYEARPYQGYPEERRVNNFTVGALKGPGKLALYPLIRAKNDDSEAMVFVHLGRGLCGHDGIIHGGLLATLLDESLARTAIINLPEKVGVTAKLSLNYRAPTKADQFVVIKTRPGRNQGQKSDGFGESGGPRRHCVGRGNCHVCAATIRQVAA